MVRLIDKDGEQLGVKKYVEALQLAQADGLDLVEVSPKAEPPVCKIMDYGHFLYTQSKQKQKAKAKSKRSETKGIRLTYNMGAHDLEVRVKQAKKFFDHGDKVKTEVRLLGRQKAHPEKAKEVLERFTEMLGEVQVEQPPKREGNKFITILAPGKKQSQPILTKDEE
jgi:translation initiation factor IF-3